LSRVLQENFLVALVNLAIQKGSEYSALPVQNKCDTTNITKYDYSSVDTTMLIMGLISLSWLSVNIKKKRRRRLS
jgi:hypothetical protein